MTIEQLLHKFGSENETEERAFPQFQSNHTVQAFVNGREYFSALETEIEHLISDATPGRHFYMTAWWLGLIDAHDEFTLGPKGFRWKSKANLNPMILPSRQWLLDAIRRMTESGVDVRILAWCDSYITKFEMAAIQSGLLSVNLQTLLSVASLREIGDLAHKVMLNMRCHPLGGAHAKLVVCGNTNRMNAYTSGIDPEPSRMDNSWHDVGVRVEGFAAKACYDFFKEIWKEQLEQKPITITVDDLEIASHKTDFPEIPAHSAPEPHPIDNQRIHVQVLRTLPAMRFSSKGPAQLPKFGWPMVRKLIGNSDKFAPLFKQASWQRPPISFATQGIFEFSRALRNAISRATDYIFIADQAFNSLETMDWINRRLRTVPDLKVILLYGADPMDPPNDTILHSINQHLIRGLDQDTIDRRIVYCEWRHVTVHAKVTIIDDQWCAIGSANCMRRSHYTDIELSVGILDATWVRDFRRQLWAQYTDYRIIPEEQVRSFSNLRMWHPTWPGYRSPNVRRKPEIARKRVPISRRLWSIGSTGPASPATFDARRAMWFQVNGATLDEIVEELNRNVGEKDDARKITSRLLNFEGTLHEFRKGKWTFVKNEKFAQVLGIDKSYRVVTVLTDRIWRFERLAKQFDNLIILRDTENGPIKIYCFFSDLLSNLTDPDSRQTF